MTETARLALPLLAAGQAQKEMTVNEALARLDIAVHACVVEVGRNTPPAAPADGDAWILGAAPTGAWTGRPGALAGWTAGGRRFVAPREGLWIWSTADRCAAVYDNGGWRLSATPGPRTSAIGNPVGGAVVDVEARATLGAVLLALRHHNLIVA